MATVNTSDNRYGVAQYIVAPTLAEGANYTTIASAITAASAAGGNQTIFIRPGTYTENLTMQPSVNLCSFGSESSMNATGHVIIKGKCTFTQAGSITLSGIQLETNGSHALEISGSANSIVNLNNCFVNCTNSTGILYSSSGTSSELYMFYTNMNVTANGYAHFSYTGAGSLRVYFCFLRNTGNSTTANTCTAGNLNTFNSAIKCPINTSSTGGMGAHATKFDCYDINTNAINVNGSGSHALSNCTVSSGSAVPLTVQASKTINCYDTILETSNTNLTDGSGTLQYSNVTSYSTSNILATTTQTPWYTNLGKWKASGQPAFLAQAGAQANVTGDATLYTITFAGSEIFDQDSNFSSPTFTAPQTGKYIFSANVTMTDLTAAMTFGALTIVTSNRTYVLSDVNPGAMRTVGNAWTQSGTFLCDMDSADTAVVKIQFSNGTKVADVDVASFFSGNLMC